MVGGEPSTPCCRWTVVQSSSSVDSCVCVWWATVDYRWLATRYMGCCRFASTNATPSRRRVVLCCVAVVCSARSLARCRTSTELYRHMTLATAMHEHTVHAHLLGVPSRSPHRRARCKAASRLRSPTSERHNSMLHALPDAADGSCSRARLDRTEACRRQHRRSGCIDCLCACGQQVDWCGRGGGCAHRS